MKKKCKMNNLNNKSSAITAAAITILIKKIVFINL